MPAKSNKTKREITVQETTTILEGYNPNLINSDLSDNDKLRFMNWMIEKVNQGHLVQFIACKKDSSGIPFVWAISFEYRDGSITDDIRYNKRKELQYHYTGYNLKECIDNVMTESERMISRCKFV